MGFYNDIILPRVCDLAMRNAQLRPYRERVIGAAEGLVIEIGVGSAGIVSLSVSGEGGTGAGAVSPAHGNGPWCSASGHAGPLHRSFGRSHSTR